MHRFLIVTLLLAAVILAPARLASQGAAYDYPFRDPALADDMDHDREVADDPSLRERNAKYVADLVVCALRCANVFPGGVIDLQRAVEDRITEKNSTPLAP